MASPKDEAADGEFRAAAEATAGRVGTALKGSAGRHFENMFGRRTWGVPKILHTSCDLLMLVEQSTEVVASSGVVDLGCCAVVEWS